MPRAALVAAAIGVGIAAAPIANPTPNDTCAAARQAGVAPIYKGQPGYRRGLDRDGDGIACSNN